MRAPRISLLLLCVSTQALHLAAESITVRVLNAKSGKPMKGQIVEVLCENPPHSVPVISNTNKEGIATLVLPNIAIISLFVQDLSSIHLCSHPNFVLAKVLSQGVVGDNICYPERKLVESTRASPGEVVIFVKTIAWWEGQR